MQQGYGKINLIGNDNNYDIKLQAISDNTQFNITYARYYIYLYNMKSGQKAEGRINIGGYSSPKIYFRAGL